MINVIGIEFKKNGKVYWFNPDPLKPSLNEAVVVETIRGIEMGFVVTQIKEIEEIKLEHELKPVIRIASKIDIKNYYQNIEKAKNDLIICNDIIKKHKLEMKLLDCEYTLDKSKIIIYYNANGRVDFRELLKDLAGEFRVRIELRQVGPREGTKFLGGLGMCGRVCCCKNHLREFNLVTMKMAKDQNMSLSASKIAGLCGKLMCCIEYENDLYQSIRAKIPLPGDIVDTPKCKGCKVVGVDILRERIKTIDKDETIDEWAASSLVKVASHKEEIDEEDLTDDIKDE